VQGYLNTILAGYCGDLSEKQKHWLVRSNIRIEGLTELISDLLDFARIEKGAVVREMRNFSLAKEITQCVSDLQQMAGAKQLDLLEETDVDLPDIYGSDVHIRRVLNNLICNAINYTPENGKITVRAVTKGHCVLAEVIDNGMGIPKDELSKVFQDFYRASNAKNIKGTGLGLSITKSIVEIHGGEVWVESPVPGSDRGCKFSFTLPIMRDRTLLEF
jgi:signal transduction histidine kinase